MGNDGGVIYVNMVLLWLGKSVHYLISDNMTPIKGLIQVISSPSRLLCTNLEHSHELWLY